jgi:hypothetical protein
MALHPGLLYPRLQGYRAHGTGQVPDTRHLPPTLDEFYTLAEKDGPDGTSAYALAWDQEGDLTFPRLKDADGDDLLNKADGGSDPDDSQWDTDFDGLSDLYEAQNGSDLRQRDVDGDDLSDYDEALLRTNPYRADTDSDGLLDSEEVFHEDDSGNWVGGWEFAYGFDADGNPLSIWVSSDPLTVDGDDDGLTDFQEKTFGFNPNVETDADILTLESQVREVDAPWVLLHFDEDEGATTFSDSSGYDNHATCSGDACPEAGVSGKYGYALQCNGNQYLSIAHSPLNELKNNLTVAAWIKPAQLSGVQRIAATARQNSTNGFGFGLKEADLLFTTFGVKDYRLTDPGLQTDQWQHVAAIMDGNNDVTFYVNGVSKGTVTHTQPANPDPDDTLLIGATTTVGGSPVMELFQGLIDEIALFDRALSPEEVQTLYEAGGLTWERTPRWPSRAMASSRPRGVTPSPMTWKASTRSTCAAPTRWATAPTARPGTCGAARLTTVRRGPTSPSTSREQPPAPKPVKPLQPPRPTTNAGRRTSTSTSASARKTACQPSMTSSAPVKTSLRPTRPTSVSSTTRFHPGTAT